jgi:hypothetical protein
MNCAEFIKKIKAAAKVRGLSCRLDASRGKGSHATLYLGGRGDRPVALTPSLKTVRKKSALVFWLQCLPIWI